MAPSLHPVDELFAIRAERDHLSVRREDLLRDAARARDAALAQAEALRQAALDAFAQAEISTPGVAEITEALEAIEQRDQELSLTLAMASEDRESMLVAETYVAIPSVKPNTKVGWEKTVKDLQKNYNIEVLKHVLEKNTTYGLKLERVDVVARDEEAIRTALASPIYVPKGDPKARVTPDLSRFDGLQVVVVDIEATGLSANDRILEISLQPAVFKKAENGWKLLPTGNPYTRFVNEGVPIPDDASQLTGISSDMIQGAPTFKEIAPEVRSIIGDATIVIHNARYDLSVINASLQRIGDDPLPNPVIDTVYLAEAVNGRGGNKLSQLMASFCIERDGNEHRAQSDVFGLVAVAPKLLDMAERVGLARGKVEKLIRSPQPSLKATPNRALQAERVGVSQDGPKEAAPAIVDQKSPEAPRLTRPPLLPIRRPPPPPPTLRKQDDERVR